MPVVRPALHHVALTVTDLEKSARWYEAVFDISFKMEEEHKGGLGRLLADDGFELAIVLHRHESNDAKPFSETRTGLDHFGLGVPTRADLEAWRDHLEANGVVRADAADRPLTQSPITDAPYGSVLVFRDPDNIQLELFSPPGT
jgi:glyoxylase I family protein